MTTQISRGLESAGRRAAQSTIEPSEASDASEPVEAAAGVPSTELSRAWGLWRVGLGLEPPGWQVFFEDQSPVASLDLAPIPSQVTSAPVSVDDHGDDDGPCVRVIARQYEDIRMLDAVDPF